MDNVTDTRKVFDTVGLKRLIAKVKKSDEFNVEALEEEAAARQVNDELLEEQIREVAVQTDWDETDSTSLAYLKNHPLEMTDSEINNLINALD